MNYVFSGNGMSAQVAEWIGDIPGAIGYIFPVYGWRLPRKVRRDLAALTPVSPRPFLFAVFTCGDDVGKVDYDLEATLGVQLDAAFSVVMPDTYLGLPGFRLDSVAEKQAKLTAAKQRCAEIRERLLAHERVRELKRGPLPWLKTAVIGRIFDRFMISARGWRVDRRKCIKCGKCSSECPCHTIKTDSEGLPQWQNDGSCTACWRCYHRCPAAAISRVFTAGKGQLVC